MQWRTGVEMLLPRKWSRGFTLIEILIVLSVLAILAAVVTPNVAGFLGRGKERAFEADKRLLQAAVDAWRTDIANRSGNPWPTITGSKGAFTNCAESGVETNGVDVGTIQADCHIVKVSLLTTGTYLKGNDVVKSFAYSASTTTGATNTIVGSYVWYIDASGLVQARRWTPASDSDTAIAASEISSSDGFATDVYP